MKQIHLIIVVIICSAHISFPPLTAAEAEEESDDSVLEWLSEYFTIGGTLEIETWWREDFDGTSENRLDLATSELEIGVEVAEWAVGAVVFEWDTDKERFRVDEATVTLGPTDAVPAYTQFGLLNVPFGVYDGNTVSDPLTKEAFEIKETAIIAGIDIADFYASVYVFDGDAHEGESNGMLEQYGASIGYRVKTEGYRAQFNLGYVNSVTGSETLSEEYDMGAGYVSGLAAQAGVRVAEFVFLAEYIAALEHYEPRDEDEKSTIPSSYHLEAGYNFIIMEFPALLTVAYSHSSDVVEILPESRLSVALWLGIIDEIGLNFEYTQDGDYDRGSGGTGIKADIFTIQLSAEF